MRRFFRGLNGAGEHVVRAAAGAGQADVPDAAGVREAKQLKFGLAAGPNIGKFLCQLRGVNPPTFITSFGIDFVFRKISFGDEIIKVRVWDHAGQQRFKYGISPNYLSSSTFSAILLLYDPRDGKSFVDMANRIAACLSNGKVCWLVEYNVDPEEGENQGKKVISSQQAQALADKHNINFYQLTYTPGINAEGFLRNVVESVLAPEVLTKRRVEIRRKLKAYREIIPYSLARGLVVEGRLPMKAALEIASYLVGELPAEKRSDIAAFVPESVGLSGQKFDPGFCTPFFKKLAETCNAAGASEGNTADPDPYDEGKAEDPYSVLEGGTPSV